MVQSNQILSRRTTTSSAYSLVTGTAGAGVGFSETLGSITVRKSC